MTKVIGIIKNSYLRDAKFQELSEKLHIPDEKLKARWRTLRDKFYKDLKKRPSGSGVYSPDKKWKWMESLKFLKDVEMDNLNTQGNYGTVTTEGDDSFLSDFGESACSSVNLNIFSQSPQTQTQTGRKRKIEELLESSNRDFQRVTSLAAEILVGDTERSAIQLFFESLVKQAEGANLNSLEMSELQLQISQTFHQFLVNRRNIFHYNIYHFK
ncbi:uncharacterized protein LOC120769321 [Bactrocera tryoni]|uniref:uncharacterized protein LOC120769321 n=1 Tax=Bactrocera tryoni TaxID=59916 RepID=UPI001A96FC94|nr:uncharacterized protein LOC120769321 [Bactrocera tryoni]